MTWLLYIIGGLFSTILVLFGLLQFWFWTLKRRERFKGQKLVKKLTRQQIPKLTKQEQFKILDGTADPKILQRTLNQNEVDLLVLEYFIDIEPDEYLEHLKKNPPTYWQEDTYGNCKVVTIDGHSELQYFDRGRKTWTKKFENHEKLLKYLVHDRLTKMTFKYRKKINKNYYA